MNSKLFKWVPAFVLLSVAISQMVLAQTSNLTPWRGGGFGMFSTIDRAHHRRVVITGYDQQGQAYRVLVKRQALKKLTGDPDDLARISSMPSEKKMKALAQLMLDWKYTGSGRKQKELLKEIEIDPSTHIWFKNQKEEILKFVRPVEPNDNISKKKPIGSLVAIEMAVWRLHYNSDHTFFFWTPISDNVRVEK